MAWQSGNISDYRDLLAKMIQFGTSKNVTAVTVNAGGTGYTVGDTLTIPHAGGTLLATAEVLTVAAGVVTSVKLRNFGAYSNRVATVTVNAGGTGYPISSTVYLAISGGTFTQACKVSATVNGSGVITAATILEGGGAYSVAPAATAAATTTIGPSGVTGSGCTINTTMTGLIGTTGIATTGGTGTGCTLNLTLTDGGWTAVRDRRDYSVNSILDEMEVVMQGTVPGGDEPYVGLRSYTATVSTETRYGLVCCGMQNHNPGLAFGSQVGIGPTTGTPSSTSGAYIVVLPPVSMPFWFSFSPRRMAGVVKTQGVSILAYQSFYLGHLNPFGTTTENPYPIFIATSCAVHNQVPDSAGNNITGIVEALSPASVTGPVWFYRKSDASWVEVRNSENLVADRSHTLYPLGQPEEITDTFSPNRIVKADINFFNGIGLNTRATASRLLKPTPMTGGDLFVLIPVTLVRTTSSTNNTVNDDVHGELDNVFWLSGTKSDGNPIAVEDTITQSGKRYRIFQNGAQTQRYHFFCMEEA